MSNPQLQAHLDELAREVGALPAGPAWDRFIDAIDARFSTPRLVADVSAAMRGWSSFENLFHMSPTPTMEQDYSELLRWMDALREAGVSDIRAYLADDIEVIRAIVPMIRIVAANPAAVKAVGLPADQLLGPIDPIIVNDEAVSGWMAQLEAVWHGWPVVRASFRAGKPGGGSYDAETTLSAPVIDGRPDFTRAVFTITDVSGHRNEERRMQTLMDGKNRFLASVSHEIRTPLTAVLGFAQLLDDGVDLDPDDRRLMVSSIAQQAQDVANLVEDLLVVARAESGQVDITRVPIDVCRLISDTLAAGGSYTEDVTLNLPPRPLSAIGDPARVKQILRNLLTNAERYGGPCVSVSVSRNDDLVHLSVCDDGPGLPRSRWEDIFEPYHTAHESPGRPGSVGIGLAVSRQLAELMGGSLDYRVHDGRSEFRLGLVAASG